MKKDQNDLDHTASPFYKFHTPIAAGMAHVPEWPSAIENLKLSVNFVLTRRDVIHWKVIKNLP